VQGAWPSGDLPRPRRRLCLLKGCEQPFRPSSPQARYCSAECRAAARRWRCWRASRTYRASEHGQARRRDQSRQYRQRRRARRAEQATPPLELPEQQPEEPPIEPREGQRRYSKNFAVPGPAVTSDSRAAAALRCRSAAEGCADRLYGACGNARRGGVGDWVSRAARPWRGCLLPGEAPRLSAAYCRRDGRILRVWLR
jgi:hypothetical protein